MSMNVSDSYRYQSYATTLSSLQSQLDKVSQEVSSGTAVIDPSDNPTAYSENLTIQAELSQTTQYKSNLTSLQTQGSYYDTSLNSMGDLLTTVDQLAVQMSSSTVDASSRTSAADQVNEIISQLVALGNTKVGDTYIFGGEKANTAPYQSDGTFLGTNDVAKVAVDASTTIDAGISGNTVFTGTVDGQSVDIFATLKQFSADLANNDTSALQTDLTNIGNCVALTSNNLANVGTYTQNISSLLTTNSTADTTLTQMSSDLVNVDMAQAISDYTTLSTAYQAALYTMSKVEGLSILNYLPA